MSKRASPWKPRLSWQALQAALFTIRRVSVGVWPDWGRVELDSDGRRIYKGGRNRAYLDHLAMTGKKTRVIVVSGEASRGDVAALFTRYPIEGFVDKDAFKKK